MVQRGAPPRKQKRPEDAVIAAHDKVKDTQDKVEEKKEQAKAMYSDAKDLATGAQALIAAGGGASAYQDAADMAKAAAKGVGQMLMSSEAMEALGAFGDLAGAFPFLGPIGIALKGVSIAIERAKYNREEADKLGKRVKEASLYVGKLGSALEKLDPNIREDLLDPLEECMKECEQMVTKLTQPGFMNMLKSMSKTQGLTITRLAEELQKRCDAVSKSCQAAQLNLQVESAAKMDELLAKFNTMGGGGASMDPEKMAEFAAQAGCKAADELKSELSGMGFKLDEINNAVAAVSEKLDKMDRKLDDGFAAQAQGFARMDDGFAQTNKGINNIGNKLDDGFARQDQNFAKLDDTITKNSQTMNNVRDAVEASAANTQKHNQRMMEFMNEVRAAKGMTVTEQFSTNAETLDLSETMMKRGVQVGDVAMTYNGIEENYDPNNYPFNGENGPDGEDGEQFYEPAFAGNPGEDGHDGEDGREGHDGAPGQDGHDLDSVDVTISYLRDEPGKRVYKVYYDCARTREGLGTAGDEEIAVATPDGKIVLDMHGGSGGLGGKGGNGSAGQQGGQGGEPNGNGGRGGDGGKGGLPGHGGNGGRGANVRVYVTDAEALMAIMVNATGGTAGERGGAGLPGPGGLGGLGGSAGGKSGKPGKAAKPLGKATREKIVAGKQGNVSFCLLDPSTGNELLESGGKPYMLAIPRKFANVQPASIIGESMETGQNAIYAYGQYLEWGPIVPINVGRMSSPSSKLNGHILSKYGVLKGDEATAPTFGPVLKAKNGQMGMVDERLAKPLRMRIPAAPCPLDMEKFPMPAEGSEIPEETATFEAFFTVGGLKFENTKNEVSQGNILRVAKQIKICEPIAIQEIAAREAIQWEAGTDVETMTFTVSNKVNQPVGKGYQIVIRGRSSHFIPSVHSCVMQRTSADRPQTLEFRQDGNQKDAMFIANMLELKGQETAVVTFKVTKPPEAGSGTKMHLRPEIHNMGIPVHAGAPFRVRTIWDPPSQACDVIVCVTEDFNPADGQAMKDLFGMMNMSVGFLEAKYFASKSGSLDRSKWRAGFGKCLLVLAPQDDQDVHALKIADAKEHVDMGGSIVVTQTYVMAQGGQEPEPKQLKKSFFGSAPGKIKKSVAEHHTAGVADLSLNVFEEEDYELSENAVKGNKITKFLMACFRGMSLAQKLKVYDSNRPFLSAVVEDLPQSEDYIYESKIVKTGCFSAPKTVFTKRPSGISPVLVKDLLGACAYADVERFADMRNQKIPCPEMETFIQSATRMNGKTGGAAELVASIIVGADLQNKDKFSSGLVKSSKKWKSFAKEVDSGAKGCLSISNIRMGQRFVDINQDVHASLATQPPSLELKSNPRAGNRLKNAQEPAMMYGQYGEVEQQEMFDATGISLNFRPGSVASEGLSASQASTQHKGSVFNQDLDRLPSGVSADLVHGGNSPTGSLTKAGMFGKAPLNSFGSLLPPTVPAGGGMVC